MSPKSGPLLTLGKLRQDSELGLPQPARPASTGPAAGVCACASTEPPATQSVASVSALPASRASSVSRVSAPCLSMPSALSPWAVGQEGMQSPLSPHLGCELGSYGEGCGQQCDCKGAAPCDPVTGLCLCPPGRTGATCDLGESEVLPGVDGCGSPLVTCVPCPG